MAKSKQATEKKCRTQIAKKVCAIGKSKWVKQAEANEEENDDEEEEDGSKQENSACIVKLIASGDDDDGDHDGIA